MESASYDLQAVSPNSNGSFCPGEIELTCIGRGVSIILNWFINESMTQYIFSQTDTFPIKTKGSHFNITIVSANGSLTIDYVSTLSGNFCYLNGASIQCGRDSILSNKIVVLGYSKLISSRFLSQPSFTH